MASADAIVGEAWEIMASVKSKLVVLPPALCLVTAEAYAITAASSDNLTTADRNRLKDDAQLAYQDGVYTDMMVKRYDVMESGVWLPQTPRLGKAVSARIRTGHSWFFGTLSVDREYPNGRFVIHGHTDLVSEIRR